MQQRKKLWLLVIALLAIMVIALIIRIVSSEQGNDFFPATGVAHDDNDNHGGPATRSFQVADQPVIVIKGHNSNINVHSGSAGTVIVTAKKPGSNLRPDDDTSILYNQSSDLQGRDHISITTDPFYKDVDYDVTVPNTTQLQVDVNAGSIAVDGISGVTIDTGSGSLDVEDIHGPMDVHTESGDITARNVRGQMRMEAGSGSIRVNGADGQLQAITRSGDVVVREASLNGQSIVKTDSGSVRFDGIIDPKGTYKMATNSGDVDLTLPDNAAFQLNASTGSGTVHNEFGSDVVGTIPQAQVTITIGSGSITVDKAV